MKPASTILTIFVLSLAACDTMNQPITSGDFDPLRMPGGSSNLNTTNNAAFTGGQIVTAAMNNTAFFKDRPKGDADADKLLTKGTSMKVISMSDSYVKVELDGSGEIGWVPSVQLDNPNNPLNPGYNPGEYQIYPPLNVDFEAPLPPIDAAGLPPEGAIPTVIDPESPTNNKVLPPLTPTTDTFPAKEEPKKQPAPLPPNGEETDGE
jgi:hypothetical protein